MNKLRLVLCTPEFGACVSRDNIHYGLRCLKFRLAITRPLSRRTLTSISEETDPTQKRGIKESTFPFDIANLNPRYKEYSQRIKRATKLRPENARKGSHEQVPYLAGSHPLLKDMEVFCVPDCVKHTVDNSWLEITLPFTKSKILADSWTDLAQSWSVIRFGKFYSLLDALTADAAKRHLNYVSDVAVVTACHYNSIKFNPTSSVTDYLVRCYVTAVWSSSMEVRTEFLMANAKTDGNQETLIHVVHTVMVALDEKTRRPVKIPELSLSNNETERSRENERKKLADEHKMALKNRIANSLSIREGVGKGKAPSPEEMTLVHHLFQHAIHSNEANKRERLQWMQDWTFDQHFVVVPEYQNLNGEMFGGWVALEGFNLAYFTAMAFTGSTPIPIGFDELNYRLPVRVGDLIRMTSKIVYTNRETETMRIWVTVNLFDSKPDRLHLDRSKRTNKLQFHFKQPKHNVQDIHPETYSEVLMYLDAKRWHDEKGF